VLALNTRNEKSDFWVVARAVAQFARDCGAMTLSEKEERKKRGLNINPDIMHSNIRY